MSSKTRTRGSAAAFDGGANSLRNLWDGAVGLVRPGPTNASTPRICCKESLGQLWDYNSEAWARRLLERWRAQLKWQRLNSFEKFAAMIERHGQSIAAYCKRENKVALGLVAGVNNPIRVIQRRAYGLQDEQYLKLKVLTCT